MKRKLLILGCVDLGAILGAYAATTMLAYVLGHAEIALAWLWLPVVALLVSYKLNFGGISINETIWR